jgi:hypothetical protein
MFGTSFFDGLPSSVLKLILGLSTVDFLKLLVFSAVFGVLGWAKEGRQSTESLFLLMTRTPLF